METKMDESIEDDSYLLSDETLDSERANEFVSTFAEHKPQSDALGQRKLGYFMIAIIIVIWVGASFVIQYVETASVGSFTVTFAGTSLFVIYLPIAYCYDKLKLAWRMKSSGTSTYEGLSSLHEHKNQLLDYRTIKAALVLMPLWFGANFFYNSSLCNTSVGASTILSGTSASFTLLIGSFLGIEVVNKYNVSGVIVCLVGIILIGLDASSEGTDADTGTCTKSNSVLGDFYALVSAFFYALYALWVRYAFPDGDKSVRMEILFGYVGFFSILFLGPVFVVLLLTKLEDPSSLTPQIILFIIGNGLINNVLSDYLWGRAVLLTSPTITTVSLSLTMPSSVLLDYVINSVSFSMLSFIGATLVVFGFLFVVSS